VSAASASIRGDGACVTSTSEHIPLQLPDITVHRDEGAPHGASLSKSAAAFFLRRVTLRFQAGDPLANPRDLQSSGCNWGQARDGVAAAPTCGDVIIATDACHGA
jgi:hypothetical protein